MRRPISEQVVVITGASSGIGLATARAAARCGARVVMAARNAEDLEREAEKIRREGGEALAVPTDVTDYAQVEALARRTVEQYGRIDSWVNNAAVLNFASFREQPLEDFRQVVETDFFGQVYGAKAALPYLEESAGALICVGSAYSDRGAPLWSSYSASKHAIKGWLDALRVELIHEGSPVRVTLVKPSTINTPLYRKTKTQRGVEPVGIPPIYEPEVVAREILRAAEENERDIYVGGSAVALSLGERISPKLLDRFMLSLGYPLQRTDDEESARASDNLYTPTEDDGGVRGEFGSRAFAWSPYQSFERHGAVVSLVGAVGLGAVAVGLRAAGRADAVSRYLGFSALALAGRAALRALPGNPLAERRRGRPSASAG